MRNFCVTVCREQGDDMAGNRKMYGAARKSAKKGKPMPCTLDGVSKEYLSSLSFTIAKGAVAVIKLD